MSESNCSDVCEMIIPSLVRLGFSISDGSDHADVLEALAQCKLVKKEDSCPVYSQDYPVTFEDKGLRDFLQENFEAYFKSIVLTDDELDLFKRHLEASLSDWISENWHDFMQNRGD